MIHPGEILLEEFVKPMELSLARVSQATGIPRSRLTEITKGRRRVSADTALRLSACFGTTAEFWLGLQADHDLEVADREFGSEIRSKVVPIGGNGLEDSASMLPENDRSPYVAED